jgi:hypothetical protein
MLTPDYISKDRFRGIYFISNIIQQQDSETYFGKTYTGTYYLSKITPELKPQRYTAVKDVNNSG